jgi:CheY-like chemotaxis protein/anti-sigma regulatory factor (Ser/Thr protein kinase)
MIRLLDHSESIGVEAARQLRAAAGAALSTTRLQPGLILDLLTAVSEIVNNIVEHANSSASEIRLLMDLSGEWLDLVVEDDAEPFKDSARFFASAPLNPLDLRLEDGGLGLFMIRRLFPDCEYIPGSPNRFRLRRNLAVRRPRILLIEDDTSLRRLYEGILLRDFDVVPCATGAEAMARFESTRPDLVLTDIHLPDMDGIDLLTLIDSESRKAPVPLVIVSGDGADVTRQKAIDLGVDGFLSKPVTPTILIETMRRVLARAKREQARLIQHYTGVISSSIAPRLPEAVGSMRTALRYATAGVGGGDFALRLAGTTRETVIIGDVMGHGHGAKILCHALAGYMAGLARSLDPDTGPGELLRRLSDAVADDALLDGAVVTVIAIAIDPNGAVYLANAGHPVPLLVSNAGVRSIGQVGPLPGLMACPIYHESMIRLEEGERLLIYTDGVLSDADSVGDLEHFPSALRTTLVDGLALPIHQSADLLVQAIQRKSAGQTPDDWCCVLFESLPTASE